MLKYSLSETLVGVLKTRYGKSVEYILGLAAELKKDYPELIDDKIEVKMLGWNRFSGMFSVEALVENVKPEYERWNVDPSFLTK